MEPDVNAREMSFDSSLFDTLDTQLTSTEFKDRLVQLLQPILQQRFVSEWPKQQVRVRRGRINFACPYCGDSMKSAYAKRGNFITEGKHANFYKCHNCGEFKRIDKFFSDFNISLNLDAVNYIVDNIGDFTNRGNVKYESSLLFDLTLVETHAIDRKELKTKQGLIEVKGSKVWPWLMGRSQFSEEKFLYNPDQDYLLMLNLTPGGKIIGMQKRKFRGENRFESYRLSRIYEDLGVKLELEQEQVDFLDTLSMVFNLCLVRFDQPITLFEGPMDSFLFKNSIANTGASKELPIDVPVRYWYDDDPTGRAKTIEHINRGDEVFLWDRFKKDLQLPYRKKWDLNDVVNYLKSIGDSTKGVFFDNYFSADPLDALDI